MHYEGYNCAKLASLFLFKVKPIVRTSIISISWRIIDNDNDNNNDNDDDDDDMMMMMIMMKTVPLTRNSRKSA